MSQPQCVRWTTGGYIMNSNLCVCIDYVNEVCACMGVKQFVCMIWWLMIYHLVSNIRHTSNMRRTPTFGNSQLEFSPTISLAKYSNTRRTLSIEF